MRAKSSEESSRFSDRGGRVLGGEDSSDLGTLGEALGAEAVCLGMAGGADLGAVVVLWGMEVDLVLAGVEAASVEGVTRCSRARSRMGDRALSGGTCFDSVSVLDMVGSERDLGCE